MPQSDFTFHVIRLRQLCQVLRSPITFLFMLASPPPKGSPSSVLLNGRFVHTEATMKISYHCVVNTNTCCHDTIFFHCHCSHNWVQSLFHDGNKIMKIMSLPSQYKRASFSWKKNLVNRWPDESGIPHGKSINDTCVGCVPRIRDERPICYLCGFLTKIRYCHSALRATGAGFLG